MLGLGLMQFVPPKDGDEAVIGFTPLLWRIQTLCSILNMDEGRRITARQKICQDIWYTHPQAAAWNM